MASTSKILMERKYVYPTINKAEVESLKKYAKLITEQKDVMARNELLNLKATYGWNIFLLLDVDVSAEAIHTLAQFYDSPMRCFTFRDFQMAPTLEEYSYILGFSRKNFDTKLTYKCLKNYSSNLNSIAAILRVGEKELKRVIENQHQIQVIRREYLEKRMEDLKDKKDWKSFTNVLALTIYGIVLFPRIPNYVDMAAIDVFMAVKSHNENPVAAILADTYCTLTYLHEKNKNAKLRCCLPMLYVWLTAHAFRRKGSYQAKNAIEDFKMCDEVKKMKNKQVWIQHLSNLKEETVRWYTNWEEISDVIYQCGDYENVPLIGTKGCIDYNPYFGIRQLGYSMMIQPPNEEKITPFVIYEDEMIGSTKLKKCREAWSRVIKKGRAHLGKRSSGYGVKYQDWLKARVEKIKVPYCSSSKLIDEEEVPPITHSDHGNEEEAEKLRSTLLKAEEDNRKLQKELDQKDKELDEKDISLERSMKMAKREQDKKIKYKQERDEYKQERDDALAEVDRLKSQLEELTKRNQ